MAVDFRTTSWSIPVETQQNTYPPRMIFQSRLKVKNRRLLFTDLAATPRAHFLDLPNELLSLTMSQLRTVDLYYVAASSQRLYSIAHPLYLACFTSSQSSACLSQDVTLPGAMESQNSSCDSHRPLHSICHGHQSY